MDYLTEEVQRMIKAHRRGAFIKGFVMGVVVALIFVYALGCRNIQEWKTIKTIDHMKKIEVAETYYKSDTGFDLGTEGLGEYNIIKVAPSAIGK